jgi:16S rRNA (uracil1498-N3)-methyltransferase
MLENPSARIALVVGPEGGLSVSEIESLAGAGVKPVTLGPSILRTETAAVVALGLAMSAALEAGHTT